MNHLTFWLPIVFFIIAFSYSMVGFGGGSSYLAILVLTGLPYQNIPPTALICNLMVVGAGFWNHYRAGYFRFRILIPFMVTSIPLAYFGGSISISKELFSFLLGLALLAVALRMFISEKKFENTMPVSWKKTWFLGLPLGGGLGFISGLLGIGGGIFLSPLLLMMRWVELKEAGACASCFIFVNSVSGLLGHLKWGHVDTHLLTALTVAVFLGGQIGSRVALRHVPNIQLTKVLAALILSVSIKLLWQGVG